MNFVSALNFVPMTSSGRAFAISMPSRLEGTLDMSRNAEFLSVAGGILVERGQVLVRLLWVFFQEKTSNTFWKVGSWTLESASVPIGVLLVSWVLIVSKINSVSTVCIKRVSIFSVCRMHSNASVYVQRN